MKTKEEIAAEAYQVIGVLADGADLMSNKKVIEALDYFGDIAAGDIKDTELLPFSID